MLIPETILLLVLFIDNLTCLADEIRAKRNVVHGPSKLINEPACKEIKNLCNNLPADADDLTVLECVNTFLTSQVEVWSKMIYGTQYRNYSNLHFLFRVCPTNVNI